MEIAEVHMSGHDILAIIKASESFHAPQIAAMDTRAIVNSLRRLGVINKDRHIQIFQEFADDNEKSLKKFYAFVKAVSEYVPFFGFAEALEHAGYGEFSQKLIKERDKCSVIVSRSVIKREIPNAKTIHQYYLYLKKCADNNMFENKTLCVLNQMITILDSQTCICSDTNRLQLLVDKRCVLYFILTQQCSCVPERNVVLKRMRDTMPRDVDRTVFDIIFHTCMSFNWAIRGDAVTAENHEKQARIVCDLCVNGFVRIVMSLWSQYKNNILYLHSDCRSEIHLNRAKADFEMIQECLEELNEDEQDLWKTISVLDMVRSTVGIHSKFETLVVCDFTTIEERNVDFANRMLELVPVPRDMRRRMYYLVLRGRLHERTDRLQALEYVEDALALADDGCYETVEKRNIQNYLKRLRSDDFHSPSL